MSARSAVYGCLILLLLCAAVNAAQLESGSTAGAVLPAFPPGIDPGLREILAATPAGQDVSVLVHLTQQVDLAALDQFMDREQATMQRRHEIVVRALQELAASTQGDLRAHLDELQRSAAIKSYESFWLVNAIRVDGPAAAILALGERPDVDVIFFNYPVELVAPLPASRPDDGGARGGIEPGILAIKADKVWEMGLDGEGVLVATMDTGVDGNHPALKSRWAGVADPRYAGHPEWAWHDSLGSPPSKFPTDTYWHGTHTMGTVCGGAPGDAIGVAPGAFWISDNTINQSVTEEFHSDVLKAYEWFVDPDGDPSTFWDVPAVVSNSWGTNLWFGVPPCDQKYWAALDAAEAAGIVVLFSAGNEGPSPNTLRRPADRAADDFRTCAVGAVDGNNPDLPMTDFSSRGPSYCTPDGKAAVKPEISAPGYQVRSAMPGGGYEKHDGTSMASPHVNGVVALMKQACPELQVEQVKQILYDTAMDKGAPGKDNDYGYGVVDAYAAVQMALGSCGPHPPTAFDWAYKTPQGVPVATTLRAKDYDEAPEPLTFIVISLPAHGSLSEPGGAAITSVPYPLPDGGNEVVYKPKPTFMGEDSFQFKANDGGVPPDGGDSNVATNTITVGVPTPVYVFNLDSDPGWPTQGQWAFGQPTGQGGKSYCCPDPKSGATGLNVYGVNLNGDYSTAIGGPYYVTLGPVDLSNYAEVSVKFQRWLNTDYQPYVYATIDVSNNGSTWLPVWDNGGDEITATSWALLEYDLSDTAEKQAQVYVRWGYQVTSGAFAYSGWNIDDVEIWGLKLGGTAITGDINCDGRLDAFDIDPFALALTDPAGYAAAYPDCDIALADMNGDGMVDGFDIDPFVAALTGR